jgi:hypothetical protein
LKRVRNPFEYDVLARMAADRLGVGEVMLRAEGTPDPEPRPIPAPSSGPPGAEALLVELMASDASLAARIAAANVIGDFEHPAWRQAAQALATAGDAEREAVVDGLPRDLRDRIVRRLLGEFEDEDRERALTDCIAKIRAQPARRAQHALREEIRAAEARGDADGAIGAMRRLRDLTEKART